MWAGGPAPWEYVELVLCRDVYHCTPVELERVPADVVLRHLAVLGIEADVNKRGLKK